ncbi:hypothetical protein PLUA15_180171 [Pseudomonas lundensis]|uniref:Uncharacterized protein n=1 Tax=Pseudomonas lundensis TaxID=86185 RepID=A0AAX2H593_9PSED|nr:hypothetical protein PLUA15_180171 [Pseudomonas lundensis]
MPGGARDHTRLPGRCLPHVGFRRDCNETGTDPKDEAGEKKLIRRCNLVCTGALTRLHWRDDKISTTHCS